ncbi:hypothetical protein A2755_02580 [Candidatus Wolfebacteria bacterium RIFCSPHIGHO2_01_FULL_48_22]|uniref:Anti-sigma factor antagonist n=2 Tax=Candidatus Wolfeibacteriota TaxID=1752735 RepID=A0A1F8DRL0_9BACT|nr:MAG: hypothetical protein A2755_02580 [Candidatus Wolfebacteria bacterium RIFCSPHIGHO2_01_FULL_48_22]OGM92239.1 MAG: hypothetical protein A2935_00485 [Candidatus Wolfebacteria bacterium RIFCSPLOWO2_01_FULL_47_17b]
MKFSIKKQEHGTVVSLRGDIMSFEPEFREALINTVQDGKNPIVLDLEKVKFVNASGLGVFLQCHILAKKAGRSLRIANAPEKVLSLFVITKFSSVFQIFDSVEKALNAA